MAPIAATDATVGRSRSRASATTSRTITIGSAAPSQVAANRPQPVISPTSHETPKAIGSQPRIARTTRPRVPPKVGSVRARPMSAIARPMSGGGGAAVAGAVGRVGRAAGAAAAGSGAGPVAPAVDSHHELVVWVGRAGPSAAGAGGGLGSTGSSGVALSGVSAVPVVRACVARRARAWYSGPCLRGSAYSLGFSVQYVPLVVPYQLAPRQSGSNGPSTPSYEVEPSVALFRLRSRGPRGGAPGAPSPVPEPVPEPVPPGSVRALPVVPVPRRPDRVEPGRGCGPAFAPAPGAGPAPGADHRPRSHRPRSHSTAPHQAASTRPAPARARVRRTPAAWRRSCPDPHPTVASAPPRDAASRPGPRSRRRAVRRPPGWPGTAGTFFSPAASGWWILASRR